MEETADVQGTVIGLGTIVAIAVLVYGTLVSETVGGVATITVAAWVLAATLAAVALLHGYVGQYRLAAAFGGAAVGWLFVLLGTAIQVLLGLVLLVGSGAVVALVAVRRRGGGAATDVATSGVEDAPGTEPGE